WRSPKRTLRWRGLAPEPRLGVRPRIAWASAQFGRSSGAYEDPRARQTGGRLQHQDPAQVRRLGSRTRQRQDVDESFRPDRGRGSAAAEGSWQGDRNGHRLYWPAAG